MTMTSHVRSVFAILILFGMWIQDTENKASDIALLFLLMLLLVQIWTDYCIYDVWSIINFAIIGCVPELSWHMVYFEMQRYGWWKSYKAHKL